MGSTFWEAVVAPHHLKSLPRPHQSIMHPQIITITITLKIRMEATALTMLTMVAVTKPWEHHCLRFLIKVTHRPIITFLAAAHVVSNYL